MVSSLILILYDKRNSFSKRVRTENVLSFPVWVFINYFETLRASLPSDTFLTLIFTFSTRQWDKWVRQAELGLRQTYSVNTICSTLTYLTIISYLTSPITQDPAENVFYLLCFIMTADCAPGPFARGLGSLKPDLKWLNNIICICYFSFLFL